MKFSEIETLWSIYEEVHLFLWGHQWNARLHLRFPSELTRSANIKPGSLRVS